MSKVKWILYAILLAAVAGLLHYSLPKRDIVRITGQEVKRQDSSTETGAAATRDVNFIFVVDTEGEEAEYRNEDTDFGWPPYFKFDTQNVASKAANNISTADNPKWVVITYYGWRFQMSSSFPNIVSIRPAEGPDEPLYPWFNGIVVAVLVIGFLIVRRFVIVLYGRHVDPLVDAIDKQWDDTTETVSTRYQGVSGWFRKLLGR
ncbi:DUF1523 family protein [Paralimibaculum aggregatum]|uniref:DUF1523 family protein n=1 Tax=Paralimibaculum aggregatum TaxID=3036245 RepID=A0ABQ6LNN1_9RHOB|nr:DUF1523 family protein [Limibaculum sp. NKW23]GMG84768.1 DUF1523 family protein [Limibaculum sp. NKW23]